MNKVQNRQISMFQTLVQFAKDHPELVLLNPAFQRAFQKLGDRVAALQPVVQAQMETSGGQTAAKSNDRTQMISQAAAMSALVGGWASEQNMPDLELRNRWSRTGLTRLNENALPEACTTILQDARTALSARADVGITADALTALEASIGKYREAKTAPRTSITNRSTKTKSLQTGIDAIRDLLKKQLDKYALAYKDTHPEFYTQYKESRKLVDPAPRAAKPATI